MKGIQGGIFWKLGLIVICVVLASSTAVADTMNFESVAPYVFIGYSTFTQNGLTFYSDAAWVVGPANMGGCSACVNNGTNVAEIYRAWFTTGSNFNLLSFDYSRTLPGGYTTLYVEGSRNGTVVYSTSFNLDLANGFLTANLNWANVDQVFMYGTGGIGANFSYFTVDNVAVGNVPEPSTIALMGTGLVSASAMFLRRRIRRA